MCKQPRHLLRTVALVVGFLCPPAKAQPSCPALTYVDSSPPLLRQASDEQASAMDKLGAILPWLPQRVGARILNVGSQTGQFAAGLAEARPDAFVLATESSPEEFRLAVRTQGTRENLELVRFPRSRAALLGADAVVVASQLHHSDSGKKSPIVAASETLSAAYHALAPGGVLVVREFVRPDKATATVIMTHQKADIRPGHSFQDFAALNGLRCTVVGESAESITYRTDLGSAYEYIYHKDYHQDWDREAKSHYGVLSSQEALAAVEKQGFTIEHTEPQSNAWVWQNRILGKISLRDPVTGKALVVPSSHRLIVARKPSTEHPEFSPLALLHHIDGRIEELESTLPKKVDAAPLTNFGPAEISAVETLLESTQRRIRTLEERLARADPAEPSFELKAVLERLQKEHAALTYEAKYHRLGRQWSEALEELDRAKGIEWEELTRKNFSVQKVREARASFDAAAARLEALVEPLSEAQGSYLKARFQRMRMWATEAETADLPQLVRIASLELKAVVGLVKGVAIGHAQRRALTTAGKADPFLVQAKLDQSMALDEVRERLHEVTAEVKDRRRRDIDTLKRLRGVLLGLTPPRGRSYKGPIFRYGGWSIHDGNIRAHHRYSRPTVGTLYASFSKAAVSAELGHYELSAGDSEISSQNVTLNNILDLTDPKTCASLGVDPSQLVREDYLITQVLGELALHLGYEGLRVPSARLPGEANLLIFHPRRLGITP